MSVRPPPARFALSGLDLKMKFMTCTCSAGSPCFLGLWQLPGSSDSENCVCEEIYTCFLLPCRGLTCSFSQELLTATRDVAVMVLSPCVRWKAWSGSTEVTLLGQGLRRNFMDVQFTCHTIFPVFKCTT